MQSSTYTFLKYVFRRFSETVSLAFSKEHGKNCRPLAPPSHVLGRAVYWVFAFIYFFLFPTVVVEVVVVAVVVVVVVVIVAIVVVCDGNGRGTERYKSIELLEQTK